MPTKAPTFRMNPKPSRTIDRRPTANDRGYDDTWRKFRAWYAANHPAICTRCSAAHESRLMVVDHIVPIADGGERLNADNCQWLCRDCHAVKTGEDRRKRAGGKGV